MLQTTEAPAGRKRPATLRALAGWPVLVLLLLLSTPLAAGDFIRGEINGDGITDISDAISWLQCLFAAGSCPRCESAADANDDGVLDISDGIFLLGFLFAGGRPIPEPRGCGTDPTADRLACASHPVCDEGLRLEWPMPGLDRQDWVINNYVDLDTGAGLRDYMGRVGTAAKTYNGHQGIDIDVPTFRSMDAGFPVLAAAAGVVEDWHDDQPDRNVACAGTWNFVTLRHPNGWRTIYGHLRRDSVVVVDDQAVLPGDILGIVGSSGCSTTAHLHFEVHDDKDRVIEPFAEGMWIQPPVYETPLGFMDASLRRGDITNVDQIKDPPPNVTALLPGETLGVGLSVAGGVVGNRIEAVLRDPLGAENGRLSVTFDFVGRHTWWFRSFTLSSRVGTWTLQVFTNGSLAGTYNVNVGFGEGSQQVRHGVPQENYQGVFDELAGQGFRPVWVDGFDAGGRTYFNAIFEVRGSSAWTAHHNLTAAQYQAVFNDRVAAGFRLVHIDAYLLGGEIRYAAIFVQEGGPDWIAYHEVTAPDHQARFNDLVAQGFRPIDISVVDSGGSLFVSALYDRANVGGWVALFGLDSAGYQAEFDAQTAAGRTLHYLDGYRSGGTARFSAIWTSVGYSAWAARHDLTGVGFQNEFDLFTSQGLGTRIVTGYENGGVANFGGMWAR